MSTRAARAARRKTVRDAQSASPFGLLLDDLIEAVPALRGAAIVDFEGETVDYAGELDPYEVRVVAATLTVTLAELRDVPRLASATEVRFTTTNRGYVMRVLDPSYTLVLVTRRLATFVLSDRLLRETEARILHEAGLPMHGPLSWHRIEVELGPKGRPRRLRIAPSRVDVAAPAWVDVEVLGSVPKAPGSRDTALRVRLANGAELNVLREDRGAWFVDERIVEGAEHLLFGAPSSWPVRGRTTGTGAE